MAHSVVNRRTFGVGQMSVQGDSGVSNLEEPEKPQEVAETQAWAGPSASSTELPSEGAISIAGRVTSHSPGGRDSSPPERDYAIGPSELEFEPNELRLELPPLTKVWLLDQSNRTTSSKRASSSRGEKSARRVPKQSRKITVPPLLLSSEGAIPIASRVTSHSPGDNSSTPEGVGIAIKHRLPKLHQPLPTDPPGSERSHSTSQERVVSSRRKHSHRRAPKLPPKRVATSLSETNLNFSQRREKAAAGAESSSFPSETISNGMPHVHSGKNSRSASPQKRDEDSSQDSLARDSFLSKRQARLDALRAKRRIAVHEADLAKHPIQEDSKELFQRAHSIRDFEQEESGPRKVLDNLPATSRLTRTPSLGNAKEDEWHKELAYLPATPRLAHTPSLGTPKAVGKTKRGKKVKGEEAPFHRKGEKETASTSPLHNDSRLVPDEVVKAHMSYLGQLSHKIYFDEEKAMREVFTCIAHFPAKKKVIIEFLLELRQGVSTPRHIHRYDKVLALLLEKPGSEQFICSFLKVSKDDIEKFAEKIVDELYNKKNFLAIIARVTQCELLSESPETLFRETPLSSCLCRIYGCKVWEKELKRFSEALSKEMKRRDLSELCLNRNTVIGLLKKKNPSFEELNSKHQNQQIENELASNAKHFADFARVILPKIFQMKVPMEISEMMHMRRRLIIGFLKIHPIKKQEDGDEEYEELNKKLEKVDEEDENFLNLSRIYISEVFCLRILNPYILSLEETPVDHSVLVSLSKVIQCLAKEAPFGAEKLEPPYELLNPLYSSFLDLYRSFIDQHSLTRFL